MLLPEAPLEAELAAAPAEEDPAVGIRRPPGPRRAARWLEARWLTEGRTTVGVTCPPLEPAAGPVTGVGGGGGAAGGSGIAGAGGGGGGDGAPKHMIKLPLI